jgi:membrane protein implicated in regulation of membrane protease activity
MDQRTMGMLLIAFGVLAIIAGVLAMTGALGWFGRLPGDIRIESGNTRVYIPIVTMLLISIVLSLVMAIVRRFF